jgi:hypothetical protein
MGDVIQFRPPGQCCGNCLHYVPPRDYAREGYILDGPPRSYCQHPDRVQGYYIAECTIEELRLYRKPSKWCTKYDRKEEAVEQQVQESDIHSKSSKFQYDK